MKVIKVILNALVIVLMSLLVWRLVDANNKYNEVVKDSNTKINELSNEINNLKIEYEKKDCKNRNAVEKLNIKSVYGDNEAYHPKVLYFENGWNGYKYWMAYSPYPQADDSKENPHIAVSNDLNNWKTPEGLKNPLDEISKIYKKKKIYNSDPHLVYNNDLKQLECWWRFVNDVTDQVIIYRRTSKNGVNWSNKEIILNTIRSKQDYVSPTIIYENGEYHLWYVSGGYKLNYTKSKDLKKWNETRQINLNYNNSQLMTWHFDIIHNKDYYEAVLTSFNKNEGRDKMNIYYTKSADNITWEPPKLILTPSFDSKNWDNKGLYRASLLHVNNEYHVFYSGFSWTKERGIGLISGSSIENLCYKKEINN